MSPTSEVKLPLKYDYHGINDANGRRIATFTEEIRMDKALCDDYAALIIGCVSMIHSDIKTQAKELLDGYRHDSESKN